MTDDEFKLIMTKMVSEVAPDELKSYPAWDHVIYLAMRNLLRDHPEVMNRFFKIALKNPLTLSGKGLSSKVGLN